MPAKWCTSCPIGGWGGGWRGGFGQNPKEQQFFFVSLSPMENDYSPLKYWKELINRWTQILKEGPILDRSQLDRTYAPVCKWVWVWCGGGRCMDCCPWGDWQASTSQHGGGSPILCFLQVRLSHSCTKSPSSKIPRVFCLWTLGGHFEPQLRAVNACNLARVNITTFCPVEK